MLKINGAYLTKKKNTIIVLGLVVCDKKIFQRCYSIFISKTADPWGGPNFNPMDNVWAILVEVH